MPKREQLLSQLQAEQDYGVLLAVQMGGVPNEIQLLVETAEYDAQVEGLRPRAQYVIRVLGVREHKASVGVFGKASFLDDHPLLYSHNAPRVAVYFEGQPSEVNELVLDISQAHASTFGPWRNLADDINREQPLVTLLKSGSGILGIMPAPAAERMAKVFAHHHMIFKLGQDPDYQSQDEHGRSRLSKLLMLDDSYFVAFGFSVEELGKV